MGRQAKLRAARRTEIDKSIAIAEVDFLRWDVLRRKVHEAILTGRAEVEQATGQAEQRVNGAQQAAAAEFTKLAKKYGFDPSKTYTVDDVRHRLTPMTMENNGSQ